MTHLIIIKWLQWFNNRASRPVLLLIDNFSTHELAVHVKDEDSEECNHEYQDNQESKCRSYCDNKTKR